MRGQSNVPRWQAEVTSKGDLSWDREPEATNFKEIWRVERFGLTSRAKSLPHPGMVGEDEQCLLPWHADEIILGRHNMMHDIHGYDPPNPTTPRRTSMLFDVPSLVHSGPHVTRHG